MREKVWLQVNWVKGRNKAFHSLLPTVRRIWEAGRAVVVHCNLGCHRSPVGGVAVLRRHVCGENIHKVLSRACDAVVQELSQCLLTCGGRVVGLSHKELEGGQNRINLVMKQPWRC